VVRLSRNFYLFVLGRRRYWGDSVSELFGFGLEVLDLVTLGVAAMRAAGVAIARGPRVTGDGYYEAVVSDTEGNLVEITA